MLGYSFSMAKVKQKWTINELVNVYTFNLTFLNNTLMIHNEYLHRNRQIFANHHRINSWFDKNHQRTTFFFAMAFLPAISQTNGKAAVGGGNNILTINKLES